jgi:hypothetical protein
MTLAYPGRSNRRLGAGLGACLVLTIATVALVAGCGSSGKTATTSGGRSVQVLATVSRGDLTESVMGRVQISLKKGTATGVVQVTGQNASQVAAGQSVTLAFFKMPAGVGQGYGSGQGNGAGSGNGSVPGGGPVPSGGSGQSNGSAPSNGSGQGYGYGQGNGQSGGAGGGQGFFGQGGQGLTRRGKTAQGTVTSVKQGSNGSVTATIAIAKLPAGVTAKYTGIAQIQVKVLASNVLIIPTAAIKGSGSGATVQLLVNGKTQTQSVVVGQQTQTESEITSGLSAGENVVYTRTFTGRFPGSRSGQPGGQGFSQNGTAASGAPFGGATSGQ